MCIIVYKPYKTKMPEYKTLKHCWDNNDDGAGYMYPDGKQVIIKKGFMDFDKFYNSLKEDYKKMGRFTPFVLHFRISTQAGVNEECTHPFPLSRNMDDLRKTRTKSDIGIAHNGIISLTKSYYNVTVTYSDTMKFITDYASLLIKDKEFYKDEDLTTLIDRLVGGRLAIMDYEGHTTLIGDFVEENGIFYSNNTYKEDRVRKTKTNTTTTTKTTTTPSYYRSSSTWYPSNGNGQAPTEKKEEEKKEEKKEIISALNRPETKEKEKDDILKIVESVNNARKDNIQISSAPNQAELIKLPSVTRKKILDSWYLKHQVDMLNFDFKEDSCPRYYEGDRAYCGWCLNYKNCKLRKGENKDELEY